MISGGVDPRGVGCVAVEGRGWFAEEERGSGDKGPLSGTISTAHCAMPYNRAPLPPFSLFNLDRFQRLSFKGFHRISLDP